MTTASRPGYPLGAGGRSRYVLTDRDGVRRSPSRPSRRDPVPLLLGASTPPYEHLDLAGHVGDEPGVVAANRQAVLAAVGLDELALMNQVHGNVVAAAAAAQAVPEADALVTSAAGLALTVLVADCVPVALADPAAGVVAVVHAGRRGVQAGVVGATVAAMADSGAEPARITAVIGPAVCPLCYEVPADLADEVAAVVPEARALSRTGTPALHLRRAVAAQLAAAGVVAIDAVGGCTAEDRSLYSYRRDGRTGRFALLAWIAGDHG